MTDNTEALPPLQEPFAHICVLPTKDAGPTKFFTAPSDSRGFPVYTAEQVRAALAQRRQVPEQRAWAYELVERLRFLHIVTDELTLKKINVLAANLDAAAPSAQAEPQEPPGREDMNAISRRIVELADRADERRARLGLDEPQVPLTDEQIDKMPFPLHEPDQGGVTVTEALRLFARAIERAHGIGKQEGN